MGGNLLAKLPVRLTDAQIMQTLHLTSREAAKALGVGKSTINDRRAALREAIKAEQEDRAKILVLDIESKPLTVYTWSLWDQRVGLNQIVDHGGLLCFAAKWVGSPDTEFYSEWEDGYDTMVQEAHRLLSEADIVVTYNGDRYDLKKLNNEFVQSNLAPPKPYKTVDLYKVNKAQFDLPSKKLDYIVQRTGVGAKLDTGGFDLWVGCMNGDGESQKLMEEYNRGDVKVTEGLYTKLLPWLKNVPHYGMFSGGGLVCPYCGSDGLSEDGTTTALVQTYTLYNCASCGGWSRGNKPQADPILTRPVK